MNKCEKDAVFQKINQAETVSTLDLITALSVYRYSSFLSYSKYDGSQYDSVRSEVVAFVRELDYQEDGSDSQWKRPDVDAG